MQTATTQDLSPSYWDQVLRERARVPRLDAWREYMCRVYTDLMDRWLPFARHGRGLKTDLFEEAVSEHILLPAMGQCSVGIDCSLAIALAAKRRLEAYEGASFLIVGDLRRLPIRSSALEYVLSGSSLDHFQHHDQIALCLAELHRVLVPGAPAIFAFDNPHNPVVWLRNRLPFVWLNRAGLVPYYVGATYTREMALRQLEAAGFEVLEATAVAHAPRAVVIGIVALFERLGWNRPLSAIRHLLEVFEKLQYLPTRYRTGYYIAFNVKKVGRANSPHESATGGSIR